MAYSRNNPWQQSRQDTGWGLIFRLNLLMGKIERDCETGDLLKWNLHIDRIFANILYRNAEEIVKDDKGRVIDVRFSADDIEVFTRFARKIEDIKSNMIKIKFLDSDEEKITQQHKLRIDLYNLVFKKDIWIRKKMYEQKLYLRESESDPRKAIYGG
jgi:hypothetical protein